VNLTAESFCHQNNVVRPPATHQHWHRHWAGEAVTCADATAASVLQCAHLSSLPLATLNHLPLRWLTLENTHTHTYTHIYVRMRLTNTNKPNQMCLCANTNVHTQAETQTCFCASTGVCLIALHCHIYEEEKKLSSGSGLWQDLCTN